MDSVPHEPEVQSPPPAAAAVFGENLAKAKAYHQSLATDGTLRGFIGPKEIDRLWERHILNCAVVGEVIAPSATVVDVGSGAGLPGIPLALARPDLQITLIEPLLKRFDYLNEVRQELDLPNVSVIRGRAEEKAVRNQLSKVDVVTSRAVAPLGKLTRWSLPLVKIGGTMIALKGASVRDELTRDYEQVKRAGAGRINIQTMGQSQLKEGTRTILISRAR